MLTKRVASALVLIPIVAWSVYSGSIVLFVVILLAALLAEREYITLSRTAGYDPCAILAYLAVALMIGSQLLPDLPIIELGIMIGALLTLAVEVFHRNRSGSFESWGVTVGGVAYIGLPLLSALRLRDMNDGLAWMAIAFLGTWVCDTAAYAVGRSIGRRRFFPEISPRKTWEGAIAGLLLGAPTVALMAHYGLSLSFAAGLVFGVLLVAAATFGDLAESVIKRQAGVKDSSNLIPGHGGMLDRIDSLLFVFPVSYAFAVVFSLLV